MAEALVKFFLQRLNSLLRQTIKIFYGLEHQMECLITTIGDILKFSGELWSAKANASTSSWINVLRDIIRDADDLIDEFIIQMDQQRSSDRSELTKSFANGLRK
ncbi:hypothetical protein Patl1_18108 [Pistacia atlantica]|uniref:Uncharacterized protein n=1 Tax=Pistacia atlantica TaxID=434234 RepID=A0ACC1C230_9ROSI|nr:hypothetical protein Patl1_18108 [Pistacia atlantica]